LRIFSGAWVGGYVIDGVTNLSVLPEGVLFFINFSGFLFDSFLLENLESIIPSIPWIFGSPLRLAVDLH